MTFTLGYKKYRDKLSEKYSLPRLNREETENTPITSTEIETVIKNLPTNKSPPKKQKFRT